MDYITYDGTRYPIRDIRLSEYEVDVKVSCESLEAKITGDAGDAATVIKNAIADLTYALGERK